MYGIRTPNTPKKEEEEEEKGKLTNKNYVCFIVSNMGTYSEWVKLDGHSLLDKI